MSRIGIKPIVISPNIQLEIGKTNVIVKNASEQITVPIPAGISVLVKDGKIEVIAQGKWKKLSALHGLTRSLLNNAVSGLTQGFKKILEIKGVGFRAKLEGDKLVLNLGFTHPVDFSKPKGINFEVKGNKIIVSGADKQLVGETAAQIKRIRIPDVYKGKGIRYEGEIIKLKPGKAVKTTAVGGK